MPGMLGKRLTPEEQHALVQQQAAHMRKMRDIVQHLLNLGIDPKTAFEYMPVPRPRDYSDSMPVFTPREYNRPMPTVDPEHWARPPRRVTG